MHSQKNEGALECIHKKTRVLRNAFTKKLECLGMHPDKRRYCVFGHNVHNTGTNRRYRCEAGSHAALGYQHAKTRNPHYLRGDWHRKDTLGPQNTRFSRHIQTGRRNSTLSTRNIRRRACGTSRLHTQTGTNDQTLCRVSAARCEPKESTAKQTLCHDVRRSASATRSRPHEVLWPTVQLESADNIHRVGTRPGDVVAEGRRQTTEATRLNDNKDHSF
jgi:hypothetical protein